MRVLLHSRRMSRYPPEPEEIRDMELSRREVVRGAVAAFGAALVSSTTAEARAQRPAATRPVDEPFG
jgi:hypothetical protein